MKPSQKGMSLIEVLVAMGIFALLFVFISQFLESSNRKAQKLSLRLEKGMEFQGAFQVIREDLRNIHSFLDRNQNFNWYYERVDEAKLEEDLRKELSKEKGSVENLLRKKDKKNSSTPPFYSPQFVFQGEEDELQFVSLSFSQIDKTSQVLKIKYEVRTCGDNSQSCLIRRVWPSWIELDKEQEEASESLVLLKDMEEISFSYAEESSLRTTEWEREFDTDFRQNSESISLKKTHPKKLRLTYKKNGKEGSEIFFISQATLSEWKTHVRGFESFPEWQAPKAKSSKTPNQKSTKKEASVGEELTPEATPESFPSSEEEEEP